MRVPHRHCACPTGVYYRPSPSNHEVQQEWLKRVLQYTSRKSIRLREALAMSAHDQPLIRTRLDAPSIRAVRVHPSENGMVTERGPCKVRKFERKVKSSALNGVE